MCSNHHHSINRGLSVLLLILTHALSGGDTTNHVGCTTRENRVLGSSVTLIDLTRDLDFLAAHAATVAEAIRAELASAELTLSSDLVEDLATVATIQAHAAVGVSIHASRVFGIQAAQAQQRSQATSNISQTAE
jgi:hypothetical protein